MQVKRNNRKAGEFQEAIGFYPWWKLLLFPVVLRESFIYFINLSGMLDL
jgi:hypothetical protein